MNAAAASSKSLVFDELAETIGQEDARRLLQALGGLKYYVPKSITADHEIAQAIGLAAAAKLAETFGGTSISLPVFGSRRKKVWEMERKGGIRRRDMALKTGYSERHIYRLLDRKADERQDDLFGDDRE
jgi:Mor family transcriptional regulator